MAIIFNNEQDKYQIKEEWQNLMNKAAKICLKAENLPTDVQIGVTFVDNEGIRQINNEYRNKDTATDVLSFPMYEPDEELDDFDLVLLGDIVISLERTEEQRMEYNHSFERELLYLFCHGMLHLCGYDHLEDEEKQLMRQKEEAILTQIGQSR